MFSLTVDEHVEMEGKWDVALASRKIHANFQKGKRHCSLSDNCFGMGIAVTTGVAYSFNYPIQLIKGEFAYVYKKESISGNFIYQECGLVINVIILII